MNNKVKKLIKDTGFTEIYVHDVPIGQVLNSDNAYLYPLKSSGSYLSPCKLFILQESPNGFYDLVPNSNDMGLEKIHNYFNKKDFGYFRENFIPNLIDLYKTL